MKTKLFTLLFAVAASVGTIFADGIEVDGIWYDFDSSTKTATVTYRGYSYDSYDNEYSGDVVIPSSVTYNGNIYSVTSIGDNAFRDCTGLTSVTIGNSVTEIGYSAFRGCTGLTSVTIGNSVTEIGYSAFRGCTGLTSITIPNSVTLIGDWAFSGCSGLTSITIPNSVTSIGDEAFAYCTGLTSITIPNSVTSIGGAAFYNCTSLTSVTIPNSVTSIGDAAFAYCTGLTSVTIPNSVTSIGDEAFAYCTGLKSITCEAITPPSLLNDYVFYDVNKALPLYVPLGSMESYRNASGWSEFTNRQPITASETDVTTIQTEPTGNSVIIFWPAVEGATVYTIEIRKDGELVCTLSFNESGQLLNISFAKHANKNGLSRTALQTATGWKYTITGLDSGTEYTYTMIAKNGETELFNESKSFTTTGGQGIEEIVNDKMRKCENEKIIIGGHLYILRDGKIFTVSGAKVR